MTCKGGLLAVCAAALAAAAWGDVEIGPEDGFAAATSAIGAKMEKTKDSLVFTDIQSDMQVFCHVRPVDSMQVKGIAFRYRASGETTKPKAGGEVFYATLGGRYDGARIWSIPPLVRDGEWHVMELSLKSVRNLDDWRRCGLMTDFRFDPTNAEGGRLEIAWLRVLTGGDRKPSGPAGVFHGEDAWPELTPETYRDGAPAKSAAPASVDVECRGGTALPRVQTAGGKVRLRYEYRGPVPEEAFMPASVALVTEGGEALWSEELDLPLRQCVRRVADDVWAVEFDYELPRYIAGGAMLVYLTSPCLAPTGGRQPCARLEMKRIATDPEWPEKVVSEVVDVAGKPWFAVNGKPIYPLWGTVGAWASGRRGGSVRHSSAPLNVVTVWTRHLNWWPRGDEFDPSDLDRLAERHRRDCPGAYFIWDISIYPPPDWGDANPGEMARDEQGNVNMSRGDIELNYSFASKKAYDDMERVLRKVIAHLESSPYANRIIGYRVNSGHTVEWLGWDPSRKDTILDFSPVAQKGFEAFAKERYPWVTDYSVPTLAERRELDEGGGFLWDQRRHARAIAYHDFYSTAVADGVVRMCRAAKECLGGKKLVGTYYGYVMTLNGGGCNQMRAHFALKRLLDSGAVDFLMSPQSYDSQSRQPGTQICDMKPFASIQSHGVVSVIEDDTRTHNIVPVRNCQTVTEQMTVDIMRRNMGVSLCRCQPFYTLAITSGSEFDFPQFADDAAEVARAGEHAMARGVRRNAQIAVVASEEAIKSTPMYNGAAASEYYVGTAMQAYDNKGKVSRYERMSGRKNSTYPYVLFYNETARIGAGVDFLLAEDIADNPGDYRLYVFQSCTKLTPALQRAAERLRGRDCTILWTYAPGYTSDDGSSTANMKALTGMDFTPCPDVTDPGVVLEDGTKVGSLAYPQGGTPLAPLFAAADPDKVLGRYSNGAAGLAEKRTGRARTVFSGSYFVEAPLLRKIAREAGVHIFSDSLDIFEANERFVSFHARNSGRKTIRLPRRTDVYDVFGRRMVARGVEEFSFDAPLHSSWLFYCGDDAGELAGTAGFSWPEPTREMKPWVYNWWMGSAVDEAGLELQCRELADKGFGGFHVIPIYGANGPDNRYRAEWTELLSPTWIGRWNMACSLAARHGLGVDLTMGSGWCFGGPWIDKEHAASSGQKVKRAGIGGIGYMLDPFDPEAMKIHVAQFDRWFGKAARNAAGGNLAALPPRAFYHDSYEYYGAEPKAGGGVDEAQLACFRVWTDWCRENGYLTRNEAHGAPSNWLDFYALADIPETEMFGRNDRDILVSKFASSAAHVKGTKLVSAESCTWIDEHFHERPAEIKAFVDRLFLSGVNHVFYHGCCYSPADATWPGWCFYASLEMNPRNPVWREMGALNAYVTRCQSIFQTWTPDNDLAVLWDPEPYRAKHPDKVMNMSIHNRADWFYGEKIGNVAAELYGAGYAFDYVSPRMVKAGLADKYAAVVDPEAPRRDDALAGARRMPFDAKTGLLATRWKKDGETAYFVVNTGAAARVVAAAGVFTAADPMSGAVASARRAVLEPGHSLFVVGDGFSVEAPGPGEAGCSRESAIAGPWDVKPVCGGPRLGEGRTLEALVGWETFDEFFSGTMLYRTTFDIADADDAAELSLGEVREVARVRLNGRDLGVKFMAPYTFNVPAGVLREKGNVLEVEVTNLGANRLRWNDMNGVDWKHFSDINMVGLDYKKLDASKWKPLPSGLLGPVAVRVGSSD